MWHGSHSGLAPLRTISYTFLVSPEIEDLRGVRFEDVGRKLHKRPRGKHPGGRTKADLVDAVYKRHGALTKSEAADVVDAIFSTVKSSLGDGRPVRIRNFGVFEVMERSGRTGVNPASGEKMFIPPHNGLAFRPSRNLKSTITDDEDKDR